MKKILVFLMVALLSFFAFAGGSKEFICIASGFREIISDSHKLLANEDEYMKWSSKV